MSQREPYRFRDAWRALQVLRKDPDDTAAVFEIIDALSGPAEERGYQRWRKSEGGRRILAEKRDILPRLLDREALLALPEGSLGYEYARFTAREKLSADGLVDASLENGRDYAALDEDRRRYSEHLRDTHDLEHVVTGYGRDLRGEAALLTFGLAQGWSSGIALIVLMAYVEGSAAERKLMRDGWRRAQRAAWLAAADWEKLLPMPLDEVRAMLRVGDPPVYEPVFSESARVAA